MRTTVLFAVVLALNPGEFDLPSAPGATIGLVASQSTDSSVSVGVHGDEWATIGPVALQSIDTPSSSGEEQAAPSHDPRTAPTPDLQGFPTAPAPGGLATVALPDNFNEAIALFKRLPSEVAGRMRSPQFDHISPGRSSVGYGKEKQFARDSLLRIDTTDLTKGDFFPINWTAGHVVALMARHGEETTAKEAGRDGNLFWIRNEIFMGTTGSTEYGMIWGKVDSPWMFSVTADTRENRDALLAAFVAAAKSSPR